MGNKVTAISTSPHKKEAALKIGAERFIVSSDPDSLAAGADSLDLILNTVSADHEMSAYLPLLRRNGALVQLGLVTKKHSCSQITLMRKRIKVFLYV